MAQPFATVVFPSFSAFFTCICSQSVVSVTIFIFLNHSMGIYDNF